MLQRTISQARDELDSLIQAALNGEEVVIIGDDQQRIQLTPVKTMRRPRKAGSAAGLIKMADDWDTPLEDFADYM